MKKLQQFLAVGAGGMIGASLRYVISLWTTQSGIQSFPWATLFVNLSGAFLLSFILFLPSMRLKVHPIVLTGITTGILGSFTTFSTFSLETYQLFQQQISLALLYIAATLMLGFLCNFLGFKLARRIPEGDVK